MLSIEEARQTVLEKISTVGIEQVSLLQSLQRVTSEDHHAPWDVPASDISAMDGYAFRHATVAGDELTVAGFLPAGASHDGTIAAGHALKIMTGAPIPDGCDTVVPVEEVSASSSFIRLRSGVKAGSHIRRRGEDIRLGDRVIPRGTLLRPQEVGMLSSMGKTALTVYRRARVAVIATGDELLEPGSTPMPGKTINSNSYTLAAQVTEAGGDPILLGIARDTLEDTCERIEAALEADLVVVSGGVSVGDRDFVKEAIERLGGSVAFWKINVKPGKPLAFAMLKEKPVFALPGNPVAAMVSFELFVRPALLKAMGHRSLYRPRVTAVLEEPVFNKGERPHLVRGMVAPHGKGYSVRTTGNQSSARLSSLIQGNGLICLPPQACLKEGDEVEVMLLGSFPASN